MDPAIKQGFGIGLVIAVAAGYFGWREGWWPAPAVTSKLESPADTKPSEGARPPVAGAPAANLPPAKSAPPGDIAALFPPGDKPTEPQKKASVERGAFDIVRVEPTGEAVVAGRCASRCVVELTANGKTHDRTTADEAGNWSMTPPPLAPGDYQLGLKVTAPDGTWATSEQSVTVSVPDTPKGEVVVVLNEPNAPSRILQRPGKDPASAPPPATAAGEAGGRPPAGTLAQAVAAVTIGAVDAEKGRLFVQGAAPAGATLRVYLNNALIAQPVAGRDERWSVRVEKGLTPGDYVARVDHVEAPSGKVVARAEARFAYEGEVAEAAPKGDRQAEATSKAAVPGTGSPTVGQGRPSLDGTPKTGAEASSQTPAGGSPSSSPKVALGAAPEASGGGSPPSAAMLRSAEAQSRPTPDVAGGAHGQGAPDAANAVVASIDTANVRRGDSLWRISRKTYGAGRRYTVIFTANDSQIRDPDLIYPGQVLVLPGDPEKGAASAR